MLRKACVLGLVALVAVSVVAVGQDETYVQGLIAGRLAAQADAVILRYALSGFVFGIFHLGWVALTPPHLPAERMLLILDKPEEYQMGYLEGYRTELQNLRYMWGAMGWAVWAVLLLGW